MIVLDTNVISALMQHVPDKRVMRWLDDQPSESIWTTTITTFEVWFGLELLAAGRRRRRLEQAFADAVRDDFGGRVLAFDDPAAVEAGRLAAARRKAGRTVEIRDAQIAGIVTARRASLATRNTRHFADLGLTLIDPWA